MQNKVQFWINHTTTLLYFQGNLGGDCIFWPYINLSLPLAKKAPEALAKKDCRVLVLGGTL